MNEKLIYAVDDSRTDRMLYEANLCDLYHIKTFHNAETFCNAYRLKIPDLIICDLVMPGMDGWRLVDRIRNVNLTIPIVIATAMDGEEQQFLARNLNCGFWHKSSNYADLQREIKWHLNLQQNLDK